MKLFKYKYRIATKNDNKYPQVGKSYLFGLITFWYKLVLYDDGNFAFYDQKDYSYPLYSYSECLRIIHDHQEYIKKKKDVVEYSFYQ